MKRILVLGAVLAGIAVAMVMLVGGSDGERRTESAPPPALAWAERSGASELVPLDIDRFVPTTSLALAAEGEGWRTSLDPTADLAKAIPILRAEGRDRGVFFVDPADGRVVAQVNTGYGPWALLRASASELLVAFETETPDARRNPAARYDLLAFDLRTLAFKRSIAMPLRIGYKVYAPGMVLSADERYLFYAAVQHSDGSCLGDGPSCDRVFTGTIDLEAVSPVAILAELPRRCGYRPPEAVLGSAALRRCEDGTRFVVEGASPDVSQPNRLLASPANSRVVGLGDGYGRQSFRGAGPDREYGLTLEGTLTWIQISTGRSETLPRRFPGGEIFLLP